VEMAIIFGRDGRREGKGGSRPRRKGDRQISSMERVKIRGKKKGGGVLAKSLPVRGEEGKRGRQRCERENISVFSYGDERGKKREK